MHTRIYIVGGLKITEGKVFNADLTIRDDHSQVRRESQVRGKSGIPTPNTDLITKKHVSRVRFHNTGIGAYIDSDKTNLANLVG